MDRKQDQIEFILRCQQHLEGELSRLKKEQKIKYKLHNNKPNSIQSRKNYCQSEKGKYSASKCRSKRRNLLKEESCDIPWHEKKLIGRFYKNCPEGYEVDHIIPLSKGGRHMISNLQYLTKEENRHKSARIDWWDNKDYPKEGMREEAQSHLWNRLPCACVDRITSTRFIINEMFYHGMIISRNQAYTTLERWANEGKYAYGSKIDMGWKICDTKCQNNDTYNTPT